jgi:serine protease AprX
MAKITINGITVDPVAQAPALAAAGLHSADAGRSNYVLIQTKQPLSKPQKAQLAGIGVHILEYVPENTYLCHYGPSDLGPLRALSYVAWANIYMRGFKVAPALKSASSTNGHASHDLVEMAARPERTLSNAHKKIDVVFHESVDPNSVRDKVAAAARIDAADLKISGRKIRLSVQTRHLADIAAIDEVRHVEEVVPPKLHNNIARQILRLESANPGPLTAFEGSGQIVAVCDTGFDMGSATNVHPAFEGRVLKLYAMGRPNKANDPDGHGTHVAGSVLGDGSSAALGHSVRGTAPRANLVLQSVLDSSGGLGGLPDDLHELFQPPYGNNGARIHTNSWGYRNGDGSYNSNCHELDDFVWNNRDCVICFAGGNEGSDRNQDGRIDGTSVTPPGTAKNCITIGAAENNRPAINFTYGQGWPDDFPAEPIATDQVADDPEGMVAFSSRGPTRDQRIKPDLVAPGTFILSARSRATTDDGWGSTADPLYYYMGGTSMATPLVAGCAALVREYLATQRQMPHPSAALVKALLINGAKNMGGQYVPNEAGRIPNNAEGFGRVDMVATIGPFRQHEQIQLFDEATALDTGDEELQIIRIAPNIQTLKVTLAWSDPPGESLQNDLDLIVRAPNGRERHGNTAATSARFDRVNNVEQIIWNNVSSGSFEIIVRAFRVTRLPQPYALVIRTA